jgi:hypothetical protein
MTIDRETATQRMERCDHEGTTELLSGTSSISHCTACGKNWPARFGAGAPTVRIVPQEAPSEARQGPAGPRLTLP